MQLIDTILLWMKVIVSLLNKNLLCIVQQLHYQSFQRPERNMSIVRIFTSSFHTFGFRNSASLPQA